MISLTNNKVSYNLLNTILCLHDGVYLKHRFVLVPFIFIYCVLTFIAIAANHHQEDKEMQDKLKKTQREAGFTHAVPLKNAQHWQTSSLKNSRVAKT